MIDNSNQPPLLPEEVQVDRLNVTIARFEAKRKHRPCANTYMYEYKRFVAWCLQQPGALAQATNYITRESLDSYFLQEVVNQVIQTNAVGCVRSALQWAYNNCEAIAGQPALNVGDSPAIAAAI